jgi:hypothetical protein
MQIEQLALGLYKTIIKPTSEKIEIDPISLIQELYDQYYDGNALPCNLK